MNKDKKASLIVDHFRSKVADLGERMADSSEHGQCIAVGGARSSNGSQWVCVLCSNDAAKHLLEWADEQQKGRVPAMRAVGVDVITMGGSP